MAKAKEVLDELLVNVFNRINTIEGITLKKRGVKLSITEIHILDAIAKCEEATMSNVAKKLLVTVGSLTIAVDTLVNKGLVVRGSSENDRRKVILILTDKATEPLKVHSEFHDEMITKVISDMNLTDDSELINSLENLMVYFREKHELIKNS